MDGIEHVKDLNFHRIEGETFTLIYFFKTSSLLIIGCSQLAIGLVIKKEGQGFSEFCGRALITEGLSDIFYALSTLNTGKFRWRNYGLIKIFSIFITLSTMLFSEVKSNTITKWNKITDLDQNNASDNKKNTIQQEFIAFFLSTLMKKTDIIIPSNSSLEKTLVDLKESISNKCKVALQGKKI